MSRTLLLIASLVCAVLMFGCAGSSNNNNSAASTSEKPATSSGPATSTPGAASVPSSGDKIGVPECDDFIAKYENCTSKVPEMVRAQYKDALTRWRTEWRKLANDPNTKAQLAAACKQAAETQAAAWKMYGCAD